MSFDETEESACRLSVSVLSERWKEPGWPKAKRFVFKDGVLFYKQRRKNHVLIPNILRVPCCTFVCTSTGEKRV